MPVTSAGRFATTPPRSPVAPAEGGVSSPAVLVRRASGCTASDHREAGSALVLCLLLHALSRRVFVRAHERNGAFGRRQRSALTRTAMSTARDMSPAKRSGVHF